MWLSRFRPSLKPGYQEVEFNVVQHYTLDCETPAPGTLDILELDKSYLELEFRLKPVPLQLGAIADFLFDSRVCAENRVNLVIEDLSAEKAELAGLIASGLASASTTGRFYSRFPKPAAQMDNVLVGRQSS